MKKRGIFSLVLLLAVSSLFAAQDSTTDLGTAIVLVIAEPSFADAATNSSSSVSTITREQIDSYHAQSTAELVAKAIGVSFDSYGSLGAMQNVVIRGATSSKNLIYLDGVPLSSAHDGSFDLSVIPVGIIDHIEIIKSGAGNLGRTNAIGGMVNIITRKGESSETPYTVTIENGSFIPSVSSKGLMSLIDSQKLDISYTGEGIIASLGGLTAQNAYSYSDGSAVRDNAEIYDIHGSVGFESDLSDSLAFESQNLVSYQDLGVPGGLDWGLTPDDRQRNLLATTHNSFILNEFNTLLSELKADFDYSYSRTFFHDADYIDSTHSKHKGLVQIDGTWDLGDLFALTTAAAYSLDYVDSTDVGEHTRETASVYVYGSIYSDTGVFSLHPSFNAAYLSDTGTFSPNASLGAVYTPGERTEFRASISYAENPPSFSQLYWPFMGNPDLETEKGWNADIGARAQSGILSWELSFFARDIINAITYDSSNSYLPGNIAHSLYLGTEQTLDITFSSELSVQITYQYNKSFDLSGGNTIQDDIEVSSVRKHTAKASVFYFGELLDFSLSGEYLGKSTSKDDAFLLNLSTTCHLSETLSLYLAVDNLLNTSYELAGGGYPMPGTKVRLGGTARF